MSANQGKPRPSRPHSGQRRPESPTIDTSELYRSLVMAMAEGVILQDEAGQVCACNPSAERILGLTREQMMGRTSLDPRWHAIHEDGSPFPGETHPAMATLRTGKPCSGVIMGIHKPTGELSWISINTQPLFHQGQSKPYAVVSSFADITRRRSTEAALRQAEERFARAFHSSPVGLTITTRDEGRYVEANDAYLKIVGYSRGELLGRTSLELGIWAEPPHRHFILDQLRTHDSFTEAEVIFRRKSGQLRDVAFSAVLVDLQDQPCILAMTRDVTTEKRNAQALRLSAAILNKVPSIVLVLDRDGNVTYANPYLESALGYKPEDVGGEGWWQLSRVDPQESAREREHLVRVVRGEIQPDAIPYKRIVKHRDGSARVILWLDMVEKDKFLVGVGQDVTELEKAQLSLAQSEERFRTAFEHAAVGMAITTPQGLFLTANAKFLGITGYSMEELSRLNFQDITHPDDLRQNRMFFDKMLSGEIPSFVIEKRYVNKQGSVTWVSNSVSLLRDAAGNPIKMITLAEDITERKLAQQALAENARQLQALFDSAQDAILIVDQACRCTQANPAAVALFAMSSQELYGKDPAEFCPSEEHKRFSEFVLRGSGRKQFPMLIGGKQHVLDIAVSPNFLPSRHLCVLRDITQQHETEKKLQQAQKMEAVGQLAGGVAHDFNNLLGVILGYAELLSDDLPSSSDLHGRVEEIRKAAKHAASLTRQLLAFSRRQVLQPVTLSLNSTVANVEKMLRRLIGEDIQLSIDLSPDLLPVNADPGQIEQILMNLAVNARDAMPNGGQLTISTRNARVQDSFASQRSGLRAGDYSILSVADTGTGMNPAVQARIFEPFFTTKEVGKGTGLGLATVYGIVKQSGGYIDVWSQPEKGTRFDIYLPQVSRQQVPESHERITVPALSGSETILLVEDAAPLRAVTREFLVGWGYSVLDAGDASEALQRAKDHAGHIDLLVTDLVMPGMSGRVLGEALAATRPGIKILFLSGYTDDVLVRHGVPEGTAIMAKPYSKEALGTKVRQVLDSSLSTRSKAHRASKH